MIPATKEQAILSAISEAEDARERVRNRLREMSIVEFKPPDDDSSEEISFLDLTIPDTWKPFSVRGVYCGSMKRVSNGAGSLPFRGDFQDIACFWRWDGEGFGSMPPHKHPHHEAFLVRRGKLVLQYRGNRYTYRTGEGRRVRAHEAHSVPWCDEGTVIYVMWWPES